MPITVQDPIAAFISTYTGAGGMDIGFAQAGFVPVWANDIDLAAVDTYNSLFADHVAYAGDIRAQRLPGKEAADLVIGGPPCQGFSVAGKMDPNDPRSRHVWDFLGVVARVRPRAFVMENVKALAVNRRWSQLRNELIASAQELGYRTQLLLLNASHFGVPQARERMFLIGTLDGDEVTPVPITAGSPPTVRDALEGLPPFNSPGNDTLCKAKITPAKKPVLRRSPFAGMLFNGQGRPLDLDKPALTLPASMGGNRTPIIDQQQLETGADSWVVSYHAHLWAGGEPTDVIPGRLRRITVEEAAAIQTFPRDIEWAGSQNAAYRQIGNAVPPRLAFHVALAVRRALGLGTAEDDLESQHQEAESIAAAREEALIAQVTSVLPQGAQLQLAVEERVRSFARNGSSDDIRDAISIVGEETGIQGSDE